MEILKIDTLMYIKDKETLCRYVAYSELRKVHVLYDIVNNRYRDLSNTNLKNNYEIDRNAILDILKGKIEKAKEKIEELKKEEINTIEMVNKLEGLKYELSNLEKVVVPTENQEKAIKNTKKAIKRHTQKIKKACKEFDEKKTHEIYLLNDKIEDYKILINKVKKVK